ncbi:MAG: hypothetical protein RLZZ200_837 [Pseudomonadota bacterium]|jgi:hypothetical protein
MIGEVAMVVLFAATVAVVIVSAWARARADKRTAHIERRIKTLNSMPPMLRIVHSEKHPTQTKAARRG